MSTMKPIQLNELAAMEEKYAADHEAKVLRRALNQNDVAKISSVHEAYASTTMKFSIDLDTLDVCNQLQSGRCWIFAACNVMREILAKKYKIKKFELSQNYIAFYDKLEKCNYYMSTVLNELDADFDSETLRYIMRMAIGDGGQWDMLTSIVKKYGIVPKDAMPETYQSSHTGKMNSLLNTRLRKFTADTKHLHRAGKDNEINGEYEKCLYDCFKIISTCFGVPPKSFTFEYVDEDKKYHAEHNVTPKEFYEKYLSTDLDDYYGIINGPTEDKPYYEMFTVKYLGNVVDGDAPSFLNLPMDDFKTAVINQLKDGSPVWFGCDCGKDGDREAGIWDDQMFDYDDTFGIDFEMSKADMLDTCHSAMNHAMVITGVNLEDDKPTKWKIENSWGEKAGKNGYYVCSDTWFDKYVYQACVHKKYLNDKGRDALSKDPIVLKPWDPFGTLAK